VTRVFYGSEQQVVEQLARYMQVQHPDVLYRFDLAADLKLTVGQAARHKRLHPHRGWPDLFIPDISLRHERFGLFLELKREGTRLKKRNGDWASEHIEEQAAIHEQLREQGYAVHFAVGLDEAIGIIDNYLGKAGDEGTF
jgi:hypothetical protein